MLDIPILIDEADSPAPAPVAPATLDLKAIATEMVTTSQLSLRRHGATLREGKTPEHLRDALKMAHAFALDRDDFAVAMLEAHLMHLLRPALPQASAQG